MEIKLGDRTYFLPDTCSSSNRRKTTLKKELQEHGPEAFLASRKLSPFAGCVAEELVAAGAELVGNVASAEEAVIQPIAGDVEIAAPEVGEEA